MPPEANPHKLNLASHDGLAQRLEALKALFPEAVVEGKVDVERLKQHLGDFTHVESERYGLNWVGKAQAIRTLQQLSHATLTPMREASVNFDTSDNLIIEGDNLEVLKLLQKSYHGQVKVIYIDPPYNTGGDFVYPDNFKDGLDTYLKYSGQADNEGVKFSNNTESSGRYHSNWLSMMYPRLSVAKSLMSEDGILFVSIDDHEVANLRLLMNEIFGEDNFVAQYVWKARSGKDHTAKHVSVNHEAIIAFSRNLEVLDLAKDERIKAGGNYQDAQGAYSREQLRQWGTNDRRIDRPTMYFPVTAPDGTHVHPIKENGEEGRWRVNQSRLQGMVEAGDVDFVWDDTTQRWTLYAKIREGSVTKTAFNSILESLGTASTGTKELKALFGDKVFETVKPSDLIKHLITLANDKDAVVLDFFAGSGTTADAVMQLNREDGGNRRYILVQLPEPTGETHEARKAGFGTIAQITRERVRRVLARLKSDGNSNLTNPGQTSEDLGFKAFRLTASNFKLWDPDTAASDADELAVQLTFYVDNVLSGRTEEAILYEILLKAGLPLTADVTSQTIGQQTVYVVQGGIMLVCLANPIEEATLRGMLALKPGKMVALDVAFQGNDQLKTNIRLQSESTHESAQSRTQFLTV